MRYEEVSQLFAMAMIDWLRCQPGIMATHVTDLVRQKGRKWEARFDWKVAYAYTGEWQNVHARRQEADPFIIGVRAGLAKLGNPERFLVPELAAAVGGATGAWLLGVLKNGRSVRGVLSWVGYDREDNPADKRGRWYRAGKQVKGYRRRPVQAS